jgi:hypothetical protein
MSATDTVRRFWRWGQHGWPASFPLVQLPNPPLIAALAGWVVAAVSGGWLHDGARATSFAGLAAWAWLELESGVNWARRVLGAAGLLFVIVRLADALRS